MTGYKALFSRDVAGAVIPAGTLSAGVPAGVRLKAWNVRENAGGQDRGCLTDARQTIAGTPVGKPATVFAVMAAKTTALLNATMINSELVYQLI